MLSALVLLVSLTCMAPTFAGTDDPPVSATVPESPAGKLDALFREYDAWRFAAFPEQARARGIPVGVDRLTAEGIAPELQRNEQRKLFLEDLDAIDPSSLSPRDRLDYDLFRTGLSQSIEGFSLDGWLVKIGPVSGPHQDIPQLAERVRFERDEDYVNYLKRLTWVPANLRATIDVLTLGLERGRTPPKIILAGVPAQINAVLATGLDALGDPFRKFPTSIPPERQAELTTEFTTERLPAIQEAMEDLARFVTTVYIPKCGDSIAASDQQNGKAWYAHRLRVETTTDLTPEAIHQLGLDEVARIRAEMLAVIRKTDWYLPNGTVDPANAALSEDALFARFVAYLRTDKRFYFDDADALLNAYRAICKRVDPEIPRLFGRLPRLPYGVRAIPRFMAPTQTTAYYQDGSIPNGDPGWFFANTYALEQRPKYEMIPLALHEAVPGHHLQIAIAQELEGVREFRRNSDFTAFVEGWGLYSERLGIEMGLYENPYDDFGRLLYEMWRSCRLVVDTGMHALGMSRDEAIAFMTKNTALSELNIKNEVDRYISWPGQACAYKLGELTIRTLRAEAEKELGASFSLRWFHDVVLGEGALPLNVLEANVRRWIETKKAEAAQPG
ncbi:MAG: DUF885 domain-containing protein [Phycisphaerae bacterium]|nr:DUF885 domain-containing protein [Phycisphaerae bacterium]